MLWYCSKLTFELIKCVIDHKVHVVLVLAVWFWYSARSCGDRMLFVYWLDELHLAGTRDVETLAIIAIWSGTMLLASSGIVLIDACWPSKSKDILSGSSESSSLTLVIFSGTANRCLLFLLYSLPLDCTMYDLGSLPICFITPSLSYPFVVWILTTWFVFRVPSGLALLS